MDDWGVPRFQESPKLSDYITIRVEIPGETLCPHILLVQTSGLGLVCYKLKIHPQKATTTKWKTRGGRHQHKLATKCHAQGLFLIFIIQHVIYSFVAGHFVATKLVSQFSEGISHGLLLDYLPPSETTKCFPGSKKHIATKCFGFFMLSHIIQKRQLQNGCTA